MPIDPIVVVFLASSDARRSQVGPDAATLLPLMCNSLARHHPDARLVVLTDGRVHVPPLALPCEIALCPIADGPLMFERMKAWAAMLEEAPPNDRPYAFIDCDVLFMQPMTPPLSGSWDIAMTFKGQRMIGGFALVAPGRTKRAAQFLREALHAYEAKHLRSARFNGDEAALDDVVSLTDDRRPYETVPCGGVGLLLLPRVVFNYKPRAGWGVLRRPPGHTCLVHFIGPRKRLMPLFHRLHVERPGPWWAFPSRAALRMLPQSAQVVAEEETVVS